MNYSAHRTFTRSGHSEEEETIGTELLFADKSITQSPKYLFATVY